MSGSLSTEKITDDDRCKILLYRETYDSDRTQTAVFSSQG